jgi:L-iditol 2-dehydrogenase
MAPEDLPAAVMIGAAVPAVQASHANPSLQVTKDHTIKMVEAPVELPGPGEVLLHIKATGVCGSDIHFWKAGKIGTLVVDGDCILGHEAAGVVLRCGEGVTEVQVGRWHCFGHLNSSLSC